MDVLLNLHTYAHSWSFRQDYDLVSHITYIVCVKFINECLDLQFKVDSERQIFEKLFMANFCQKSTKQVQLCLLSLIPYVNIYVYTDNFVFTRSIFYTV